MWFTHGVVGLVHLGDIPLQWLFSTDFLVVVITPDLSWRAHVDFVCARGDRMFHQSSKHSSSVAEKDIRDIYGSSVFVLFHVRDQRRALSLLYFWRI